ncbi:MAG TPA: hypothetical protein VGI40_09820 [Pirellulaceae bacterium]|jgi:hypothetical protein
MATGTVQTTAMPPPPPAPVESVERERLIRRQLARTGWHVRLVDLASSIAVWLIGLLLLLLAAALVDHLVGLGTFGRCAFLAAVTGFSLWYLVLYVGPLLVRSINPTYAARTIEEATPTLKNSLINFLLLRQDRSGLKEIVYQAVERQAAADIAVVPVEATVDRTRLIHAGYALCAAMTFFAAYKILSPKDPFQTIARVLAPWAEIARPSRVQISEVEPGSTEVYYGQTAHIEATIRGIREGDKVAVRYSTADGQTIDQSIEMKLAAGNRYECELPPEQAQSGASNGLLQNVTYRVVAGDAETFPYRLTVVAAPTIIVDRLEYQYPSYTRKAADSLRQQGDIKALEGTKVTVRAIANQSIKSAWLEFDPSPAGGPGETVPLTADGQNAHGTLTLQLRPDRQTPWRATYQVRFFNERGQRSQQPILHRIEVLRDLAPEVQILRPESVRVSVPEDGEQTIEVRAIDPDFGLAKLYLEGTAAGKPPLNINLLEDAADQPPRIDVPYAFRPREHNLKAGDELKLTAVAEDNRTNPLTGQPEPNVTRTKEYAIVVTAAQNNDQGKSGQNQPGDNKAGKQPDAKSQPQNDAQKSKTGSQKESPKNENQKQPDQQNGQQSGDEKTGNEPQNDQQNSQKKNDGKNGNEQKGNSKKVDEKNKGNEQQQNGGKENSEKSDQGQGDQQQAQQQPGDQKSGQQKTGEQQNGKEQNGKEQGGQEQSGKEESGQQQNQKQKSQSGDQQQSGAGSGGEQSKGQGSGQQKGEKGGNADGNSQGSDSDGKNQNGQSSGQSKKAGQPGDNSKQGGGNEPQPGEVGNDADPGESTGKAKHDGQAIERVINEMQRRGQADQQPAQDSQQRGQDSADQNSSAQKSDGNPQNPQNSETKSGGQPQSTGSSDAKGQNSANPGTPEGNEQRPDPNGKSGQSQGKAEKTGDRIDDQKHGQSPAEQQSGGNKGGESHGPSKTDKGDKSSATKAENRDPGAGKNGEQGAGQASNDKSGSGDGNYKNLDHKKELKPDGNQPGQKEESPANSSHRQSDSKGGSSGENSGGGKQGAGQAGAQEGNDSAGSKSAGDQGAGKANETGSGEVGSKAGKQQPSAGKTGQSGDQKGEGSGSKAGEGNAPPNNAPPNKAQPNGPSKQPSAGAQPGNSPASKTADPADRGKAGGQRPVGGGNDNSEPSQTKSATTEEQEADAANLDYARKATEMALRRLKDAEHNPDPELLEKLGWTREDLAEFLRRWETLEKSAHETPAGQRELDEALKSLGLRDPASRRRAGGKLSDDQRNMRDAGNRTAAPPKYRELFDAFRKGAARSGQ